MAGLAADLQPDLQRFLDHLAVERRLAVRTLAMYREALLRLQASAQASGVELRRAEPHHVRGWVGAAAHARLGAAAASRSRWPPGAACTAGGAGRAR